MQSTDPRKSRVVTRSRLLLTVLCTVGATLVSGGRAYAQASPPAMIDARRSLAVTELPILQDFSLQRVMDQLAALSGNAGLTGIQLFRQWWDTQNRKNPQAAAGPHCDDTTNAGVPSINGYPYDCRATPHEGRQATCTSFTDAECQYVPIGLFNRFDLAPVDGSHCGEYRIVYAHQKGVSNPLDRNLLIFEATLPNPSPQTGLLGCMPIAQFWANLSNQPKVSARADALERFYFDGLNATVPAVVRPEHYGAGPSGVGQIRTNQFMGFSAADPKVWTLREFKLRRTCPSCTLQVVPVPDAVNPFGPLFAASGSLAQKPTFDGTFPGQVAALASGSLAGISMLLAPAFDSAQSHASNSTEMEYLQHFAGASALRDAIQAQLTTLGSTLTPDDIVARAQAMSCAGCHRLNNGATNLGLAVGGGLVWPPSLGFTHVSERETETVAGVQRFRISAALTSSFLPHRADILGKFTRGEPLPPVPPGRPIGGRVTH